MLLDRELKRRGGGARPLYVIHQTGAADEKTVAGKYAAAGVSARVNAFEHRMADAFATADIVIARAGASTCFELARTASPALLVPLPSAVRDHQHFNAEAFAASGAAYEAAQAELTPAALVKYLIGKYEHPCELELMAERMRALSVPDAADRVAAMVERLAHAPRPR